MTNGDRPRPIQRALGANRREFLRGSSAVATTVLAGSLLTGRRASAQAAGAGKRRFEGETLHVQFWAGTEGQTIRTYVVEPFMKKTGAKVVVNDGQTSDSIAKLRAQKGNQTLSVALMDDIGIIVTGRDGLLEPIDLAKIPNALDVNPRFFLEGKGIGFFVYAVALAYNTNLVKPPPQSWSVLWDPQYRIIVPSPASTAALQLSIMAAMLHGGSQYNMEPAWDALKKLKPRVVSMEMNVALQAELLKSGEAAFAMRGAYYWRPYIERGYPIGVTLDLKEGIFAAPGCAALVKGMPEKREVAEAFINECLEPDNQLGMAEYHLFGPTNKKVAPRLKPETTRLMVATQEQWDAIIPVNLDNMSARRAEWADKYTRALG